jgi:hypothetical protein
MAERSERWVLNVFAFLGVRRDAADARLLGVGQAGTR